MTSEKTLVDPLPTLWVGPRGCGKSAAVERQLAVFPARLYFGTLWHDQEYRETIARHRDRRDDRWTLLESTGDLDADVLALRAQLATLEAPAAVLIDGLTVWARNCARASGDILAVAVEMAEELVGLITRTPRLTWRLVDVTAAHLAAEGRPLDAHASATIHRILALGVPSLRLIRYGRRSPCPNSTPSG